MERITLTRKFKRDFHISSIQDVSWKGFDTFDKPIDKLISKLKIKIDKIDIKLNEAQEEFDKYMEEYPDENPEHVSEFMDVVIIGNKRFLAEQQLNALAEMKVVYLFKNIEIMIKTMVKEAFPDLKINDFYKWENMVSNFRVLDINVKNLQGYTASDELRKVNNCIKHSNEINNEVKAINEFVNVTEMDYECISNFFERVKPEVIIFIESLSEEIVTTAFTYSEERLNEISENYTLKMDQQTLERFIEILTLKLKE